MNHQSVSSQASDGVSKYQRIILLLFTLASLTLSILVLVVTMVMGDFGISSLLIAPSAVGATIIYHLTIFVLAKSRAAAAITADTPRRSPALTKASVRFAFFLSFWWFAAVVTSIILASAQSAFENVSLNITNVVLQGIEFGIVFAYAVMLTRARKMEPYGREWYQL